SSQLTFQVLATPTSVFVDNAWASLPLGTAVTASFDGQTHYIGYDAFATIQAGINAVAANGSVDIDNSANPYTESNITVATAGLTTQGQRQSGVAVAPATADGHLDNAFGSASNGFIIAASGVEIEKLTIDGNANTTLAGTQNFRNAVITNSPNDGNTYNN